MPIYRTTDDHAQDWKTPHYSTGDPPTEWPVTVTPVNPELAQRIAELEAEVADLKARERLFLDVIRELVTR